MARDRMFIPPSINHADLESMAIGIVSRGGGIRAQWMLYHHKQNPLYTRFNDICKIFKRYDCSFHLGDSQRPGCLHDASDDSHLAEVKTLGNFTRRVWAHNEHVIVEGPGHVPMDQIEFNIKKHMEECAEAPFYVLAPPGNRHRPRLRPHHQCHRRRDGRLVRHGDALLRDPQGASAPPNPEDVRKGLIAYTIAAHAGDITRHRPSARDCDDQLSRTCYAFDWNMQFEQSLDPERAKDYHDETLPSDIYKQAEFCSMCGPKHYPMQTKVTNEDLEVLYRRQAPRRA